MRDFSDLIKADPFHSEIQRQLSPPHLQKKKRKRNHSWAQTLLSTCQAIKTPPRLRLRFRLGEVVVRYEIIPPPAF